MAAALDPEGRRKRARAASLARHHPNHPEVAELRAEAAERYIRRLVDSFPPLTAEQKSRLTLLLHGGEAP